MSDNKFENSRRNYEFQISVETVEQLKLALAREYVDRIFISDESHLMKQLSTC